MKNFLENATWLLVSHAGRIASQLLGVSIIARLLTPADFGVVAIAMVVSNLAGLLRDLGTGPAAIRSRETSPEFFGGIFTVQLTISTLIAVVICGLAPSLAVFYRTSSLASVLIIMSVVFPITALGSVHLIFMERAQRYRVVSLIELSSYVAGLGVAIILAKLGVGVESLAIQAVVNAAVQTVLLRYVAQVEIRPRHPKYARSAATGSAAVTSFHLFSYVVRNLDAAIAGRMASASFVGNYSMATRISQMPSQAIGFLLSRASIPLLSRPDMRNDERARHVASVVDIGLYASATACLLLATLRTLVTGLLFGSQWLATVPGQLLYLLPAAALTSVSAVFVGIMTAVGATKSLTLIGALSAVAHVCALGICLNIDSSLLPIAVYVSAAATLTITTVALRTILREQEIGTRGLPNTLPLLMIVLYPAIEVALQRWSPTSVRTPAYEFCEAAVLVLVLLPVLVPKLRSWFKVQR